jgi:succinate dehydrogenase flavin-adding protein (antitoxin of CptAB toxin-antitoxin module)
MKSSEREILEFSRFSFIRFEFDSLSRYNDRDKNEFNVILNVSSDHDIAKIIVHKIKKSVMLLTICENLE